MPLLQFSENIKNKPAKFKSLEFYKTSQLPSKDDILHSLRKVPEAISQIFMSQLFILKTCSSLKNFRFQWLVVSICGVLSMVGLTLIAIIKIIFRGPIHQIPIPNITLTLPEGWLIVYMLCCVHVDLE